MKRFVFGLILAGAVTGCYPALPPPIPPTGPVTLIEALTPFRGQNIQVVIAKLGYPDSQREAAGDTVYEWSYAKDSTPRIESGTVGFSANGILSSSTVTTETNTGGRSCQIQFGTAADGTIKAIFTKDNRGGCTHYLWVLNGK